MSCLETHASFFRLLMKGIFDPYDKKLILQFVMYVRTPDYRVSKSVIVNCNKVKYGFLNKSFNHECTFVS